MCRASGRRCPGAGGRSTQNTRQAVSRAKTALRKARETGDPDQVTAARDRLATARTAHQAAKNATTIHDTAGQHGDVTDHHSPTTEDTSMGHQDDTPRDEPRQDRHHGGFPGFVNVNMIATGNATVGSQHGVHHGNHGPDQQQADIDRAAARLARAQARMGRAHNSTQHPADGTDNTNTAGRDKYVAQQTGWNHGPAQHGDVTDQGRTHTTSHRTSHGTVTNIVNGTNYGVQADVISGVTIVNGQIRAGHGGDVTDSMAEAVEHMRQIREHARAQRDRTTNSGTTPHRDRDESPSGGPVTITDGAGHTFIQAGRVHGEIWVNGRRVQ